MQLNCIRTVLSALSIYIEIGNWRDVWYGIAWIHASGVALYITTCSPFLFLFYHSFISNSITTLITTRIRSRCAFKTSSPTSQSRELRLSLQPLQYESPFPRLTSTYLSRDSALLMSSLNRLPTLPAHLQFATLSRSKELMMLTSTRSTITASRTIRTMIPKVRRGPRLTGTTMRRSTASITARMRRTMTHFIWVGR